MGYTNTTAHYNLPQYVSTDVPSILGDVNDAYSAIDSAIYAAAEDATDAKSDAASAVSAVSAAQADATQALADAASAQSTADSAVSAAGTAQSTANTAVSNASVAQTSADAANTLLGNTPLPTTAQTVTGAIKEINDTVNKGSVTYAATAGQTVGGALAALYALIDFSKLNARSLLYTEAVGGNRIYNITILIPNDSHVEFENAASTSSAIGFRNRTIGATCAAHQVVAMVGGATSYTDEMSRDATGTTFTIYY